MDGIERELAGRLRVLRVNIQEPAGAELSRAMGAAFTPTFIFFDEQGREVWRSVGRLDPNDVRLAVGP
ncbi:MAG TPA: hypothetical protein VFI11_04010 [Anaerolineales bacterium]|nr:hypothetical protein [Anaerolineales bacterium]